MFDDVISLLATPSFYSSHCVMARCQQGRLESTAASVERSHQLRPFVLNGVVSTKKMLGTGSYGSVLEVCS